MTGNSGAWSGVTTDFAVGRFGVVGLIVAIPSSSTLVEEFQGCLGSLGFIVMLFNSGVRFDGDDVGVKLWLCLCPFSVADASRLPWKAKSEERCFRIVLVFLVGSEEGKCAADDSLDTGNGAGGVAGDLTVPTNFLANFLKGDIDLESAPVRPDVLLFPFALGGVAR